MTHHITNYAEREASRAAYLLWLRRMEDARRGQALPPLGDDRTPSPRARASTSAAAIRNAI